MNVQAQKTHVPIEIKTPTGASSDPNSPVIGIQLPVSAEYDATTLTVTFTSYAPTGTEWTYQTKTFLRNSYFYHINWCWDGKNNGYFLSDVFDTDLAMEYDYNNLTHDQSYNFSEDLEILVATH